ncbi:hypothetical protein ACE01N_09405 [Saccharicrinis sp. FJH2]|uniref:hypothetical protein n=1 Tax=Saccharicrinis sp. FJH65 TaxID=3344659 RepID=UPI0035F42EBE
MKKILTLLILISLFGIVKAADLPDKGKKPPTTIYGAPGPLPPGPGAPVGGGVLLLLGLATAYGIKKYRDTKQD